MRRLLLLRWPSGLARLARLARLAAWFSPGLPWRAYHSNVTGQRYDSGRHASSGVTQGDESRDRGPSAGWCTPVNADTRVRLDHAIPHVVTGRGGRGVAVGMRRG